MNPWRSSQSWWLPAETNSDPQPTNASQQRGSHSLIFSLPVLVSPFQRSSPRPSVSCRLPCLILLPLILLLSSLLLLSSPLFSSSLFPPLLSSSPLFSSALLYTRLSLSHLRSSPLFYSPLFYFLSPLLAPRLLASPSPLPSSPHPSPPLDVTSVPLNSQLLQSPATLCLCAWAYPRVCTCASVCACGCVCSAVRVFACWIRLVSGPTSLADSIEGQVSTVESVEMARR